MRMIPYQGISIVPFFLVLFLMALFLWSCRYRGAEGIHASHILLSQRTDSKEKQVINLDQDVQVSGYVWWMVYELFFMSPIFFRDMGLSLFFFFILFFWHALWACGIPSLGMHLLFSSFDMPKHVAYLVWICIFYFLIAPYPWHIFERGVIHGHGVLFYEWMKLLLTSSVEA